MKYLTFFILTILMQPVFGQKELYGVLLDSISNNPIPFANVFVNDTVATSTDFDGKFRLSPITETEVVINVTMNGYHSKKFPIQVTKDSLKLAIKPIPFDDPSNFIIRERPTDTIYFKNGKIQKIEYHRHDVKEFYPNGQIKYKSANGSTRSWYKNGQLKNQSVLINNHYRHETEWYSNGQKKAEGSIYWGHNEKRNEGEWFKSEDWIYWNKNGEERNNR